MEDEMGMQVDAEFLVLTDRNEKQLRLALLLLNRCQCGVVLRAYVELPSSSDLDLSQYLNWREAGRYETRRQGKFLAIFPRPYAQEGRCCPREKFLAFALEPAIERWLKRQQIKPEADVVSKVREGLLTKEVPGLGLIRDEVSGEPMGLTWLQRAVYGGDRYWSGKVCKVCYEPVYGEETTCRARGSTDTMPVETESWEQFERRRKRCWEDFRDSLHLTGFKGSLQG
jgi:hypothetical protein